MTEPDLDDPADVPHPAEAHWFQPDLAGDPTQRAAISGRLVVCADVGSAVTKAALVDLELGRVLARAEHRSTVNSDPLQGLGAAIGALPDSADHPMLNVCSSAGGGLRLAVVGPDTTAPDDSGDPGTRVVVGSGARLVHTARGEIEKADLDALRLARPDVILLLGGGLHNAERLAKAGPRVPVVVAGDEDPQLRPTVLGLLGSRALPAADAATDPGPARLAVRDVFLRHVIGDRRAPAFAPVVRAPTPDVLLAAVELLGDYLGGDLVVIDLGAATTDVYSVVGHVLARSAEGDLGLRTSADGVVAAAAELDLLRPGERERLTVAVKPRLDDPTFLPPSPVEQAIDARLASLAAVVAVRRHARPLGDVSMIVLTGGTVRHDEQVAEVTLRAVVADGVGDDRATAVVDTAHVLAAAGMVAADHPQAALTLLRTLSSG